MPGSCIGTGALFRIEDALAGLAILVNVLCAVMLAIAVAP